MKQKLIIFSLIITILLTGCKSNNNTDEPENTTTVFAPQSTVRETEPPVISKPSAAADKPAVTKPAETTSGEKKVPTASEAHDKSSPIHIDKGTSVTGDTSSYIKGVRIPDNIYAPDLAKIGKADITDIKESADVGAWRVECGGFAYMALPSEYPDYNRFDIDDRIMDFTVTEAKSYFSNLYITDEQTDITRFYEGGAVALAGTVTMEGFIRVYEEGEPSSYKNKVVFTPKPDCMLLPIYNIPDTVIQQPFEAAESEGYDGNSGNYDIVLGNAEDFDLSEISAVEYAEASVTLNGIKMRTDINTGTYISAEGAEITVL